MEVVLWLVDYDDLTFSFTYVNNHVTVIRDKHPRQRAICVIATEQCLICIDRFSFKTVKYRAVITYFVACQIMFSQRFVDTFVDFFLVFEIGCVYHFVDTLFSVFYGIVESIYLGQNEWHNHDNGNAACELRGVQLHQKEKK